MAVTILGAGAWGTAISFVLSKKSSVTLWCRDRKACRVISQQRENKKYLPGFHLPETLVLTEDIEDAIEKSELVLLAVPVNAMRSTLLSIKPFLNQKIVVWLCKGFETGTMLLPHKILKEVIPDLREYAVLSGPSFAQDVAYGKPVALTLAGSDIESAERIATMLRSNSMRIYSSFDMAGVEVGGAMKNVIAIAAGVCDGLDLGESARAALFTRGLTEMTRLGKALGGNLQTFMGLSGAGDLSLTCSSNLSRNRKVGFRLGQGVGLTQILADLGHVAEGVTTTAEVAKLANQLGVDMPITQNMAELLAGNITPSDMVQRLLSRSPKIETIN